ncbi:MAG: 1-acyl-sn-glycerol-3-phosphate acyltransferase [Flavobacteriia bacterium]
MRLLYFIFNIFLSYSLRLYFRNIRLVNATKKRFSRTIFVSNHASAFMDPLIISVLRKPIVFFMTRSDVFTKLSSPFLASAHMIPIYRQHDGGNAVEKNKESFRKATEILDKNRSLLIFGEGMTDDVFERRLKPLKKGALRIGFTALEATNWKKEIRIVPIGCNYSFPNRMRSDILMAESTPIILNDYKDEYLENPSKTINELNRVLEQKLAGVITHIELESDFEFHEQVMMLTRQGMSPICYDSQLTLVDRWKYSKALAHFLNQFQGEFPQKLISLKEELSDYFEKLRANGMTEEHFYQSQRKTNAMNRWVFVLLAPIALLGFIHAYVPYILVKRFVEKSFKRKVFWCSTKMVLTMVLMQFFNLPILFILPKFFGLTFWTALLYYVNIGLLSLAWYEWRRAFVNWKRIKQHKKGILSQELWQKREELICRIQDEIQLNIS